VKELYPLNKYFLRYKGYFFGGIFFVALSAILATWQGVIVRKATNRIIEMIGGNSSGGGMQFLLYGAIITGLALGSGLFMFLMRQTIIVMSRHIEFDQKNELFRHYQQMDSAFFKTHTTGDLMNRISEDIGRVRMYTGPAIMYLVNTVVTTVTILIFMLNVNFSLTVLVFLPLPLLSFIIYKVSDLINRQSTRMQEELSGLTSLAQESFGGIRLIKAYSREHHFSETMKNRSDVYKRTALRLATTEALFAPVMGLMIGLSVLFTVWRGGRLVMNGEIEPGNITEFILYVFRLTWPFASLGWVISLVQRASASQKRVSEFINTRSAVRNPDQSRYKIAGAIEFRNVTFTYPENNVQALKNISFRIQEGETLGVTGQVGSGKTTLLTLLTRQYDCTSGEVLIDGKNLRDHNLELIRDSMGVATQEVFLFSDTIRNNIGFGLREDSEKTARTEAAARQAGVYDNINEFPLKFETLVGERGVTLSGGQKQRISIARALAPGPKILLLDDCLSAVDSETEELILSNLRLETKGRTAVIISHRISGISHADQILYLADGRIAESGTHEELIEKNGKYAELFRLQAVH
jgi:ATP-binding cassette subfamily B multidrug efflux pump